MSRRDSLMYRLSDDELREIFWASRGLSEARSLRAEREAVQYFDEPIETYEREVSGFDSERTVFELVAGEDLESNYHGDHIQEMVADLSEDQRIWGTNIYYGTDPWLPGHNRREADIIEIRQEDGDLNVRYVEVKPFSPCGVKHAADRLNTFGAYATDQGWMPEQEVVFYDASNDVLYHHVLDTEPSYTVTGISEESVEELLDNGRAVSSEQEPERYAADGGRYEW